MAIKPILFNTEMVRAILDGRKSCTRRINKDANDYVVPDMDFLILKNVPTQYITMQTKSTQIN